MFNGKGFWFRFGLDFVGGLIGGFFLAHSLLYLSSCSTLAFAILLTMTVALILGLLVAAISGDNEL